MLLGINEVGGTQQSAPLLLLKWSSIYSEDPNSDLQSWLSWVPCMSFSRLFQLAFLILPECKVSVKAQLVCVGKIYWLPQSL